MTIIPSSCWYRYCAKRRTTSPSSTPTTTTTTTIPPTSHSFTVTYESSAHWNVLFQCWGSVWHKVLLYCLWNVGVCIVLQYGCHSLGWNINVTDKGHSFLTLLVTFLTVTRANVSMGRYNEAMGYLTKMVFHTDQLVQTAAIVVAATTTDNDDEDSNSVEHNTTATEISQWRHDVVYHSLLLLRTSMAVIDYPSDAIPGWALPQMDANMQKLLQKQLMVLDPSNTNIQWAAAHHRVSEEEATMRVPIRLSLMTKQVIRSARHRLPKGTIHKQQELQLMTIVDNFMVGYYGMQKFLTTPFPFPLVQMARTFLFFYLFTIPFALIKDNSKLVAHCIIVFFLTFGFMGLEHVSIELDDPFGNDVNDFNNLSLACRTFEDAYRTILELDGPMWTDRLRLAMYDPNEAFEGHDNQWMKDAKQKQGTFEG